MRELSELESAIGSALVMVQLRGASPPLIEDRFRIERLLGRGSFGLVVGAHDLLLDRKVAIKCLPSQGSERLFDEVAPEVRALAALDVPQVAKIYDCKQSRLHLGPRPIPCVLIVMEWVEGVSLRRWSLGLHTRSEQIEVLVAAAKGLEAAHAASIIHRDFKPENVVVPASRVARVVDFGLAFHAGLGPSSERGLRRQVHVAGTPEYMAPEVQQGRVSVQSDQFSFAVAAWEVLTGKLPFFDAQRVPDPKAAEQLPSPLAETLTRALELQPERRFESLAQLRSVLEHCEESLWQKHRTLVTGAVAVGASLAAFALGQESTRRALQRRK